MRSPSAAWGAFARVGRRRAFKMRDRAVGRVGMLCIIGPDYTFLALDVFSSTKIQLHQSNGRINRPGAKQGSGRLFMKQAVTKAALIAALMLGVSGSALA